MKTASQVAKSPITEKPNVFAAGMSKTLMQQQYHEESLENQTPKTDNSSSLLKGNKTERSGRVNVINFNMNR